MPQDWKSAFTSVKNLAIAVCISFLLHLLFIGSFHLSLPSLGDEPQLIEAHLVANSPVAKPPVVKPTPKVPPVEQVKVTKPALPTPEAIKPEPEQVKEVQQPLPPAISEPVVNNEAPPKSEEILEPSVEAEPVIEPDTGIVNENAYKYVETEFDVRTDINAKIDSSPAGRAKIIYQLLPNAEQYRLTSLIQAKGLAALVIPDLLQTSEGYLSDDGLRPKNYLYNFGDKKDKTYSAKFDWEKEKLILNSVKGTKQVDLVKGTQDLLSFMYRFMFIPPLQNMQLHITNGKKLGSYQYSFEGEEVIYSKMGDIRTIHLARVGDDNEDKTELWLALDYQYVPVKIRKTEKQDKVYELLVTSLKTSQPADPLAPVQ